MAKGLKLGDRVTVREEMRMPRKSDAYAQGIKRLKPGDIGQIVDNAGGRSVLVEFDGGKRVKLASQRLERADAPTEGESNGKRKAADQQTVLAEANLIDYQNPNLITTVANRLLLNGGLQVDSDAVVVQVKLSDLPTAVQQQVTALMQAKLALGPQGGAGRQPKRRGRKPKNAQS